MLQFESLPNELIYLIFKYLNATDIFNGLSNLNQRFTALLTAYADYEIDFRHVTKDLYDFVCSKINPSHVQTLRLSSKRYTCGQIQNFFTHFPLTSFTCQLRSLSLISCSENDYNLIIDQLHLLIKLTIFSFVASASVDISYDSRRELVQVIAQIPSLRRCTIKIYNDELIFDISGLRFERLEYICLGISSLDQMIYLCRRAPNLKYLTIDATINESLSIYDCSALEKLTHLSLRTSANMEELERLLTKARSLISLSLGCSHFECHDGNRWQQILSKIKLSKFRFLFITDPMPAIDSLINPFYDKFWLEHGWYFRYEQQKINSYIELYTMPYSGLSFLLDLTNTSTRTMTKMINSAEVFESLSELDYSGCETEVSSNNDYFFPNIKKLNLITDTLPPSKMVSFQHVKELLLLHTRLTPDMLDNVSMPALTHLTLYVLPTTWTVPYLNKRIQYLKLYTNVSLTDQEVEAMCASTSFAIYCKHVSLMVQSKQSVHLLLNQLSCLESVDFLFSSATTFAEQRITEDWIREETCLRNFLLTIDITKERLGLWIGKSNCLL